ncbi:MAG TPA: 4Fe-4S dicluster domain-containing protein [Anaerolineaceae bacterium]|nr:4Fe-4S dicluster domain-containing protein [Anaerolineaceae bacterium]
MGILDVISRNMGSKSRTRLAVDVVPYPKDYRGTLQHEASLCVGCQTCAYVCSPSAITFDTSEPTSIVWQYFTEQCTFCGRCVQYCPTHALTFDAQSPVVTGDRSLHHLADRVQYHPCARCGRPIVPLPVPVLARLYGDGMQFQIEKLNQLCERCRSRLAGERIKAGQTGKNVEATE